MSEQTFIELNYRFLILGGMFAIIFLLMYIANRLDRQHEKLQKKHKKS